VARAPFRNLGALSILLTLVTVVTKLLGFIREILVSAWFGASYQTDAFYLVFSILLVAMGSAAAQLPRIFVPEYQRRQLAEVQGEEEQSSSAYLGASILIYLPAALLLTIGFGLFTDPLISWVAPKLPTETHLLSVQLMHAMLPIIPCTAIIAVLSSLAHARGHLILVQIATPLLNIGGVIGLLLLGRSKGVESLALGLSVGSILQCLTVAIYPFRERLLPKLRPEAVETVLKGSGVLLLLWLLNYSGGFLMVLSERYFATGLPPGHLSCMGYAIRLASLPNQVLFGGLLVVLLPALSSKAVHQDREELERLTLRALKMLLLLVLPVLAGMALLANPLVQVTFGRGAFGSDAAQLTGLLLIAYVPSLITEVIRLVIATVFFANSRPGPAIAYGLIRVTTVNLAYALTWEEHGALGMAVCLSAIDMLGAGLFLTMAHQMLGLRFSSLLPFFTRLLPASLMALLGAQLGFSSAQWLLEGDSNLILSLQLLLATLSGGGAFYWAARLSGLKELDELIETIKSMLRRRLRHKQTSAGKDQNS
tara:strand:- start:3292 stop:4905 length:1614 start_codon:yes stop_codon:yes gene_type:complete